MKILSLTLVAMLLASPVMAGPPARTQIYQTAPRAPANIAEWQVGQRVPGFYISSQYYLRDHAARNLPAPSLDQRWLKIKGKAVLIDTRNDVIKMIKDLAS